jgi:hypothetical protein
MGNVRNFLLWDAALLGAHKIFYFSMRGILPSLQNEVSGSHRILSKNPENSLFFQVTRDFMLAFEIEVEG